MKITIFMGSPRLNGNTAELCKPFIEELKWYCPPEMKAMLDRHYGMNKFYGKGRGSLWAGKGVAVIATHGYDRSYGAEPFETGIKRLCEHSKLKYLGMYSIRDEDDLASFQTLEAVSGARSFAKNILNEFSTFLL